MKTLLILVVLLGGCQTLDKQSKLLFLDSPFEGYYEPSPVYWFSDYPWESLHTSPMIEEA